MHFFVPADKVGKTLEITLSHGTGNANLLHRYNRRPSRTVFDHISANAGNEERILVNNVQKNWNYIHVRADKEFSGVTLHVRYIENKDSETKDPETENPETENPKNIVDACKKGFTPVGNVRLTDGEAVCLKDISNGDQRQMSFYVSDKHVGKTLEIILSHGSGNGNLLHRYGNRPTRKVFDHMSVNPSNEERILVHNVQRSWNYIHIRAVKAFSGVTLLPRYIQ